MFMSPSISLYSPLSSSLAPRLSPPFSLPLPRFLAINKLITIIVLSNVAFYSFCRNEKSSTLHVYFVFYSSPPRYVKGSIL